MKKNDKSAFFFDFGDTIVDRYEKRLEVRAKFTSFGRKGCQRETRKPVLSLTHIHQDHCPNSTLVALSLFDIHKFQVEFKQLFFNCENFVKAMAWSSLGRASLRSTGHSRQYRRPIRHRNNYVQTWKRNSSTKYTSHG